MMGSYDDWPIVPPPGWRPPGMREQIGWIAATVVGVALVTNVLIAVVVWYRPWGDGEEWLRRVLLCATALLDLVAVGTVALWLIWRKRRRRH